MKTTSSVLKLLIRWQLFSWEAGMWNWKCCYYRVGQKM